MILRKPEPKPESSDFEKAAFPSHAADDSDRIYFRKDDDAFVSVNSITPEDGRVMRDQLFAELGLPSSAFKRTMVDKIRATWDWNTDWPGDDVVETILKTAGIIEGKERE